MKRHSKKRNLDIILGTLALPISIFQHKRKFPNKIRKILILKFSGIGDAILTLPAIKELNNKGYKIEIACSNENFIIFKNQKFIKKIHIFNIESPSKINLLKFILNLKKEKYDVCIDTSQSSFTSAFISKFVSKYSIGFKNLKFYSRNKFFDKLINLDKNKHMVKNYYELLSDFKLNPKLKLIHPNISKKTNIIRNKTKLVGIHATSPLFYKNWPIQNYAKVIDYLIEKKYFVLLFGSPKEKEDNLKILKKIKSRNKKKVINLAGLVSFEEMFYLLPKLNFFLSNDGGPMHIAASFNIPVIGIFGAETPIRYAPFNNKSYSLYKKFKNGPIIKAYSLEWPNKRNYEIPNKITVKEVLEVINLIERE